MLVFKNEVGRRAPSGVNSGFVEAMAQAEVTRDAQSANEGGMVEYLRGGSGGVCRNNDNSDLLTSLWPWLRRFWCY